VIERLNAETNDVLAHPEMRKWQAEQGLEPLCGQPGTLGSLLAAALPRWETLVRRAGIRAD
jgi:tripartite-type tricarboxylate transporter receptor subunit TctC